MCQNRAFPCRKVLKLGRASLGNVLPVGVCPREQVFKYPPLFVAMTPCQMQEVRLRWKSEAQTNSLGLLRINAAGCQIKAFTVHLITPDRVSYWGSYFKYRKSCACAFSSLGACATAGRCPLCALGSLGLVPLPGAAAGCCDMSLAAICPVPAGLLGHRNPVLATRIWDLCLC